jgi:hypothetical protein
VRAKDRLRKGGEEEKLNHCPILFFERGNEAKREAGAM